MRPSRPTIVWVIGLLCTLTVVSFAAEPKDALRTITVRGQGDVQAVPDIATLGVEVTLEGADLDAVSGEVRARMKKALDVLNSQGIAEKDIQTEAYRVQPRFEYDKAGNARRKGYGVTNRIAIKVRDLKKVGKILSAVLGTGVTSVDGPNFEFDHPQALQRQALVNAVNDAKAKAALLAQTAGAGLGALQTLNEGGIAMPPVPRPMMAMARLAAASAPAEEPIAAGEQKFSASITATFELK